MSEHPSQANSAETVRGLMAELYQPEIVEQSGLTMLVRPHGLAVDDLTGRIEERAPKPARLRGTMTAHRLETVHQWCERFCDLDNSALFMDIAAARLVAISNYHTERKGDANNAEWGDHRCLYEFPLSRQWEKWTAADGKRMTVQEFGAFLEDNAADLMEPTEALLDERVEPESNWERRAVEIARRINGKWGAVSTMIGLGRDFSVHTAQQTQVKFDRASGQQRVSFTEEHSDDTGNPIALPSLFLIAVPLFEGENFYPVPVRFMYRAQGPYLYFQMQGAAEIMEQALYAEAAGAAAETGLTLFYGNPEEILPIK